MFTKTIAVKNNLGTGNCKVTIVTRDELSERDYQILSTMTLDDARKYVKNIKHGNMYIV